MIKKLILILLFIILVYTRLVNLGWGLPYPMHPDERNMASALQQFNCKEFSIFSFQFSNCLNPHFFAYGQFPLYLGYFIVWIMKFFDGDLGTPIGFQEAVMSLRIISSIASILNGLVVIKIINLILCSTNSKFKIQNSKIQFKIKKFLIFDFYLVILTFAFLLLTFSPYFIQFSHFGTTESLLMFFYSTIVYLSLKLININHRPRRNLEFRAQNSKLSSKSRIINHESILNFRFLILNSFFSGLALAIKVSSIIFLTVPFIAITYRIFDQTKQSYSKKIINFLLTISYWLLATGFFSIIFSPHNLISFKEFVGSIRYESDVALGRYVVFYTRQFVNTIPVLFQTTKIFPYALGWPQYILAILGFFLLSWKNRLINFLRFVFLIYFLPNAFVFAKWTRFMAPVLPLMSIFSILFLFSLLKKCFSLVWTKLKIKNKKSNINIKNQKYLIFALYILFFIFYILYLLPGLAYLSIYTASDVRFQASDWIYKNIPNSSNILSETANVVDLPIKTQNSNVKIKSLNYLSFNFYDLDENPDLQNQLTEAIKKADYIFVPSRRIFINNTCVQINQKTENRGQKSDLSGKNCKYLESKYPLLNDYYQRLFDGRLDFKEVAKFTSYPKISFFSKTLIEFPDENAEETWTVFDHPVIRIFKKNSDYQVPNYQTTTYRLTPNTYRLLIANTREKWEKGLMFVKGKQDINGADGMIFIFPNKEYRTFWNKNTLVDLDLYWLDEDGVVGLSFLPSINISKDIVTASSLEKANKVIEIIR